MAAPSPISAFAPQSGRQAGRRAGRALLALSDLSNPLIRHGRGARSCGPNAVRALQARSVPTKLAAVASFRSACRQERAARNLDLPAASGGSSTFNLVGFLHDLSTEVFLTSYFSARSPEIHLASGAPGGRGGCRLRSSWAANPRHIQHHLPVVVTCILQVTTHTTPPPRYCALPLWPSRCPLDTASHRP